MPDLFPNENCLENEDIEGRLKQNTADVKQAHKVQDEIKKC